jgi:hypothetical protein
MVVLIVHMISTILHSMEQSFRLKVCGHAG